LTAEFGIHKPVIFVWKGAGKALVRASGIPRKNRPAKNRNNKGKKA